MCMLIMMKNSSFLEFKKLEIEINGNCKHSQVLSEYIQQLYIMTVFCISCVA